MTFCKYSCIRILLHEASSLICARLWQAQSSFHSSGWINYKIDDEPFLVQFVISMEQMRRFTPELNFVWLLDQKAEMRTKSLFKCLYCKNWYWYSECGELHNVGKHRHWWGARVFNIMAFKGISGRRTTVNILNVVLSTMSGAN